MSCLRSRLGCWPTANATCDDEVFIANDAEGAFVIINPRPKPAPPNREVLGVGMARVPIHGLFPFLVKAHPPALRPPAALVMAPAPALRPPAALVKAPPPALGLPPALGQLVLKRLLPCSERRIEVVAEEGHGASAHGGQHAAPWLRRACAPGRSARQQRDDK